MRHRLAIAQAAAVIAVVIAIVAVPASAPTLASGQASTPVPADITGDITWMWDHTPQPPGQTVTGDDKQTGTFHIDLTNVTGSVDAIVGGDNSTYSITDNRNLSYTDNNTGCTANVTGSFSAGGPLPYRTAAPATISSLEFSSPSITAITELLIYVQFTETQTSTFGGPPPCSNGTSTGPSGLIETYPKCFDSAVGDFPPLSGSLNGTYPNATVDLGCSGTYANCLQQSTCANDIGSYSVTGTLTITPSSPCGGAAASSCGLAITSPPDNSTIAISDPNYVDGADIGANDRAPALNKLKLKVAGTSAGCSGPVTVNGVGATSSGDQWAAEIPLTALAAGGMGQATLTAKASGCTDASSTVTLINLNITNPTENAQEPITNSSQTGAPAMPSLGAQLSVVGYSGDTSGVSFDWTLNVRGETVARPATWTGYSETTTGSTTGTGAAWQPSYDHIVGGVGWLEAQASLPGVTDNPVVSFPRWFNIPGTNPPAAVAKSYVDQANPHYADPIRHLVCIESGWHQFNTSTFKSGNNGQPLIPNVPADWTPNPGVGQPLFGPPAGIGIAQLDPASLLSPDQYWDWQASLQGGVAVFNAKLQQARTWANHEQTIRLTKRLNAALAKVNATRTAMGLSKITMNVITVPPLTDEQTILQAIRYYNGGNEFHFDADYVISSNNINVDLVGTKQWVGGTDPSLDGVQPSPAGYWGHASTNLHLRQPWVALATQFQGYVNAVLNCKNS